MNRKPVRGSNKYKISFLILLVLMALTFHVIFKKFELSDVVYKIRESSHKLYLLTAAVMAVIYLALYGRFISISTSALGEKVSGIKFFTYGCADILESAITPSASGGQPAVIYLMAKDGVSYSTSAITVIIQSICFKVVLLFYNLIALIFIDDIIADAGSVFHMLLLFGLIVTLIGITLCLASMYYTKLTGICGRAIIRFLANLHFFRNAPAKIETFERTLCAYKNAAAYIKDKKKMLFRVFMITFMQRTAMFSIAYLVYRSFGLQSFGIVEFLCIQAVVALAVDSIPLPGGIGANELAIYLLYERVYGAENIMAAAAMLLTRGFGYYFTLIVSSIFTLAKQASMYFREKRLN